MAASRLFSSITYVLVGHLLLVYSSVGDGWKAVVIGLFGLVLYFIGLTRFKSFLDTNGKKGVGKLIWAAILRMGGYAFGSISLIGAIPAGMLILTAFILNIIGLLNLKCSAFLGSRGAGGVNLLLAAVLITVIAWFLDFIPIVGDTAEAAATLVAFLFIPFGWIMIQEALMENTEFETPESGVQEGDDNGGESQYVADELSQESGIETSEGGDEDVDSAEPIAVEEESIIVPLAVHEEVGTSDHQTQNGDADAANFVEPNLGGDPSLPYRSTVWKEKSDKRNKKWLVAGLISGTLIVGAGITMWLMAGSSTEQKAMLPAQPATQMHTQGIRDQNASTGTRQGAAFEPFYIVNILAVNTATKAEQEAAKLRSKGYSSGYLWIPDYASLSGAKMYTVYLGPFATQQECAEAIQQYRRIDPTVYGVLVAHDTRRVQINGLDASGTPKIVIKDVGAAAESCDANVWQGDQVVVITGDQVQVRTDPDASNEISMLYRVNTGDRAKVLDKRTNAKGELWYRICFQGRAGWVIGRYAELQGGTTQSAGDKFVGKWAKNDSEIFTITKNGSQYHFESNILFHGAKTEMSARLVNGELVGRASDDMTGKNTIIRMSGDELKVINLYGNDLTLRRVE